MAGAVADGREHSDGASIVGSAQVYALAAFAKKEKIPYREDATNAQLDIQRNRIRHELLPLLTKKYQPALARVVLRQMEIVGAEAEWVTESAREWTRKSRHAAEVLAHGQSALPHADGCEEFEAIPLALQRRVLQLQFVELGIPASFDLIEQLREAADRPLMVRPGVTLVRDAVGRVSVHESGNSDSWIERGKVSDFDERTR